MRNFLSSRIPAPVFGLIFFGLMALVPTVLNLMGVSGGGIAQLDMLNKIGIYAALALSLNIILGHTGLFSMGHTAFFAVGAYVTAILNTVYQWPIFYTMPVAGIITAVFALIVAKPIIHLRGDYLLVVTIGIVEIVRIALVNNVFGITGGANGIYGISRPILFGFRLSSPEMQFYLIWAFVAISVIFFYLLEHSRFGRALNYIKEDDLAAEGCGIDVSGYKLASFALGAFWAGMVGTLYAANIRTIEPSSFNFFESVIIFSIVILGGSGSITGVILGSFLLIGLQDIFREFDSARMLVFGAAMVAMMVFRPQGLLPARRRKYGAKDLVDKFPCAVPAIKDFSANGLSTNGIAKTGKEKEGDKKSQGGEI